MSPRNDHERLTDMLESMRRIDSFTIEMTETQFHADQRTISAVLYELFVIGEASTHLSEQFKQQHHDIPWPQIRAMRNVLAHAYFGVRMSDVWHTVINDLPKLRREIELIVREQ